MRNYKPLLVHFENHASDPHDREASAAMKGRAKLMLKSLKQYSTLSMSSMRWMKIHLMLDILQELKQLSLLIPERQPQTPDGLGWAADMHGFCSYEGVVVGAELPLKSVGQWVGSVVKMAAQSYSDVT
ncbi:unnamed protein product [Arctogadus glacialis]